MFAGPGRKHVPNPKLQWKADPKGHSSLRKVNLGCMILEREGTGVNVIQMNASTHLIIPGT